MLFKTRWSLGGFVCMLYFVCYTAITTEIMFTIHNTQKAHIKHLLKCKYSQQRTRKSVHYIMPANITISIWTGQQRLKYMCC